MVLNKAGRKLNRLRLKEHQHENYNVNIRLTENLVLEDFAVHKGVFRPDITSGLCFAKYLASNPQISHNKSVLDMCCGTGIQGIVAGKNGATGVTFSDISKEAVENTIENAERFRVSRFSSFFRGDLFENVPKEKFDVIFCNHPFHPANPVKSQPVSCSWLNNGELIQRFLRDAKEYLAHDGKIIMPFSDIAGRTNHPEIQGRKNGYKVERMSTSSIKYDLSFKSGFYVYHLKL